MHAQLVPSCLAHVHTNLGILQRLLRLPQAQPRRRPVAEESVRRFLPDEITPKMLIFTHKRGGEQIKRTHEGTGPGEGGGAGRKK